MLSVLSYLTIQDTVMMVGRRLLRWTSVVLVVICILASDGAPDSCSTPSADCTDKPDSSPSHVESTPIQRREEKMSKIATTRYPALFICHGGGPLPVLGDPMHESLVDSWKQHRRDFFSDIAPSAILLVSAHYETSSMKVGGAARPKMLYDYGGFPPESYKLQYPAPGEPALAAKAVELLTQAGVQAAVDADRAFDHGVFVPLMIMFPEATIPVVPVSVLRSQDPMEHMKVGAALSSLRDEGVLVIGSGSPSHNFATFGSKGVVGKVFNDKLEEVLTGPSLPAPEKIAELSRFLEWPKAEEAQVRGQAEHFTPLFTVLGTSHHFAPSITGGATEEGAAQPDPPQCIFRGNLGNWYQTHYLFPN